MSETATLLRRRVGVALVGALLLGRVPAVQAHADDETLDRGLAAEVAARPDDPETHLDRARGLRALRRWDEALVSIDRAADLGADAESIRAERGTVFLESGRPREALAEFDAILERRPDRPAIRLARGKAWIALGDPARAARELGHAVRRLPSVVPEHVIAWRDALLATGRRPAALRALDVGVVRLGPIPALELAAIDLAEAMGDTSAALDRLETVSRRNPTNASWMLRRGRLLQRLGRGDDAAAVFASALQTIESNPRRNGLKDVADQLRAELASAKSPNDRTGGNL